MKNLETNQMKSWSVKVLVCLSALILSSCSDSSSPEELSVGGHAPSFSLKSLDGATVTSNSLQGNVVILNFWATWCQPCMGEIPELKEVAAGSEAKVVAIALDQDGARTIKPFVVSNRINYTVLVGDEEVFHKFNGVGIPYTLVLDRSQRVVRIYRGPVTKESLELDLKKIAQGA